MFLSFYSTHTPWLPVHIKGGLNIRIPNLFPPSQESDLHPMWIDNFHARDRRQMFMIDVVTRSYNHYGIACYVTTLERRVWTTEYLLPKVLAVWSSLTGTNTPFRPYGAHTDCFVPCFY